MRKILFLPEAWLSFCHKRLNHIFTYASYSHKNKGSNRFFEKVIVKILAEQRFPEKQRIKMEQRDFLQKQIDQLGRALGKVMADLLKLESKGDLSQGTEVADQKLKEELDLDIEAIVNLPDEEFLSALQQRKNISNEALEKLAGILLFIADGLNSGESNKGRVLKLYQKSLIIYNKLEKEESTYSLDRHYRIKRIYSTLNPSPDSVR